MFPCLLIIASILDKVREEIFVLRCNAEVHHEVQHGEPVSIELAHSVIHLVLLSLRRDEDLAVEHSGLVALLQVLVEKFVDYGEFFLVGLIVVKDSTLCRAVTFL